MRSSTVSSNSHSKTKSFCTVQWQFSFLYLHVADLVAFSFIACAGILRWFPVVHVSLCSLNKFGTFHNQTSEIFTTLINLCPCLTYDKNLFCEIAGAEPMVHPMQPLVTPA